MSLFSEPLMFYSDGYSLFYGHDNTGNTVTISGLTLAASFIGMVMVDMKAVKALGMTCVVSTMVTVAVTITMVPALLVLTFPFQPLIRRVEIKTKRCLLAIFRKGKTAFVHPGSNQSKGRTFSMVPILLNKSMEESDLDSLDNSSSLEESLESSSLSSSKQQEQNDDSFDFPDDVSDASSSSSSEDEKKKKMTFWRRVGIFCRIDLFLLLWVC